eukprot:scaffold21988_cov53-Attheya_sp.AAC.8
MASDRLSRAGESLLNWKLLRIQERSQSSEKVFQLGQQCFHASSWFAVQTAVESTYEGSVPLFQISTVRRCRKRSDINKCWSTSAIGTPLFLSTTL